MTQDELKAAYDRFASMPKERHHELDYICAVVSTYLESEPRSHGGRIGMNRIAAMLCIEAVQAWEEAEWQQP